MLAASDADAAPVVVPPKAENVPTPDVVAEGSDVTVELTLDLSARGTVDDARVVSPPNPRFDDAAIRAMRAATFSPATRDGVPVPARIRYALVFRAPPPPVEPPPAPAAAAATPEPEASAPVDDQATFGAHAVTDAPPREVTVRTMGGTELSALGTRGDPIRAVELLPGFARTGLGTPLPIIRGSAPNESEVFFEGMPVPLLYHAAGMTSFVPARVLDRVDFYPGNFSARYGRNLGGVIDVRTREPASDALHGVLDASFIDASVFAEGPLAGAGAKDAPPPEGGVRLAAAVGARRSYVDTFIRSFAPDDVRIDAAPVYYDYQGIVGARFGDRHRARLFVYGSSDSFAIVAKKPNDVDPLVRGSFDLRTTFHRVQGDVRSELSPRLTQELSFAVGPEQYRQKAGGIANQDFGALTLRGRGEWTYRPLREVRLTVGVDHVTQHWTGDYEGVRPQIEGVRDLPPSVMPRIAPTHISKWVNSPAAYAELGLLLTDRITLIPSLRADYIDQLSALTVDPRLVVRGRVLDGTVLKAGVGRFTQHPQMWQALPESGNVALKPGWALHLSTGVEQALGKDARVSLEGFYKSLHDLPVATPAFTAPYFDNEGRGRVLGLELEARLSPSTTSPVYGLVAYTLSRSERSRKDEPLRLFDNDQTHVGSASAVFRMGRGWQAGATFRATSANPKTPIVGAVYDARTDTYAARYGAPNSDRMPLYHRLDLHLEKTWTFTAWKLMAYLDVQNVYNASNAESSSYNYDYTRSKDSPSFPPFLPSLGLRGEL